ncbi:unnamed protein product [Paramecium octaurelia]|uniref:Uncharacterized protein n=1 Tax=Paramecium octaurelia TaxID=43137 RepID=A0A8S1TWR0_PAROT|nr:unnamed protein product [Paramecium octaurelia]
MFDNLVLFSFIQSVFLLERLGILGLNNFDSYSIYFIFQTMDQYIGFQLDLTSFNSIKQIIQMKDGYVVFGEQQVEQKLRSVSLSMSNQKLLYFEIKNGECISEKPYQIGQGLAVLSNIIANDNHILALISRQGNRSLVQFNPKEHTNVHLIPSLPYKQYQIDCESNYNVYSFLDRVTLIELYKLQNSIYLECLNYPDGYHTGKKFKKVEQIQSLKIYNTNHILIVADEEFHLFDGSGDLFAINIQMPSEFKLKFIIEIQDQYVLVMKDRMDKFYKFCHKEHEIDYFSTFKCQELLNGQFDVQTTKKQSINLSKLNDDYYIWISTIYQCEDNQNKLFVNVFKISIDKEPSLISSYELWKSQEISFIQKDEFVHEYLLFRDEQFIKAFCINQIK